MLSAGDQIGPYALEQWLGSGAFGAVWLAAKPTAITTTKVALKIPHHNDVIDFEAVRREAAVWVRASGHPNVLPIIDADIYGDQVVIASEYAPDGSIYSMLRAHDGVPPSIDRSVEMILSVVRGLEHLHAHKIIHRDLKPPNILLQRGIPRLTDFGLSRILEESSQSGNIAGTPLYMAPEAFNNERTEQTDLWAAGVILYQLLAGRLPFDQRNMAALLKSIIMDEPDPLPPDIPRPVRDVVTRALQKNPSDRFRGADEMLAHLHHASRSLDLEATIVTEVSDPLIEIRKQMLTASSAWELRESQFRLDEFLSRNPNHPEARMMKRQFESAIHVEESSRFQSINAPTSAPAPRATGSPARSKSHFGVLVLFTISFLMLALIYFIYLWFF
jgi:serine/threonine-protein kinase